MSHCLVFRGPGCGALSPAAMPLGPNEQLLSKWQGRENPIGAISNQPHIEIKMVLGCEEARVSRVKRPHRQLSLVTQ
jgi:hypothetical protein